MVSESICKVDGFDEKLAREKTINIFKRYFGPRLITDILKNSRNDLKIDEIKKQSYIYKIISKYKNRFGTKKEPFKIINKSNNRVNTKTEHFIDLYSFIKGNHQKIIKIE